jgi:hypothetical protein
MEIKHVEEYEKPKFNTFQLKTGKLLMAGAACIALLGMAGALEGCAGGLIVPDFTEETSPTTNLTEEALPPPTPEPTSEQFVDGTEITATLGFVLVPDL